MKIFTIAQVAEICQVSPRTVSKRFDSGRLKATSSPALKTAVFPANTWCGALDDVVLVALLPEHSLPPAEEIRTAINKIVGKPFDAWSLAECIHTSIGAKKEMA